MGQINKWAADVFVAQLDCISHVTRIMLYVFTDHA